jgi:DNA primase
MSSVDKIKSYPISAIISHFIKLQKLSNSKLKANCPFHVEKTPSFIVDDQKGFFNCFGCNESGDSISFIQKYSQCSFTQAVQKACEILSIKLIEKKSIDDNNYKLYSTNSVFADFCHKELFKNKQALEYLTIIRNISVETIKLFQIGYCPNIIFSKQNTNQPLFISDNIENLLKLNIIKSNYEINSYRFSFAERIIIPIKNINQKIIGFGTRSLPGSLSLVKYINSSHSQIFNKKEILFNVDLAKKNISKTRPLLIVEGYLDAITLYQAGYKNAVATLGTAITDQHILEILKLDKSPVFAFDADMSGQKALIKASRMILPHLKVGILPRFVILSNAKDFDELINKNSNLDFDNIIAGSHEIQDFIFLKVSEKYNILNPNQKVAMQSELHEICQEIREKEIRESYMLFFKRKISEKLYKLQFNKSKKVKKNDIVSNLQTKEYENIDCREKAIIAFLVANKDILDVPIINEFTENIFPKFLLQNQEFCNLVINEQISDEISKEIIQKYAKDFRKKDNEFVFESLLFGWKIAKIDQDITSSLNANDEKKILILKQEKKKLLEKKKKILNVE